MPFSLWDMSPEALLYACVAIPVGGVFLLSLFQRLRGYRLGTNLRDHWPVLFCFTLLIISCVLLGVAYERMVHDNTVGHSIVPEFYAALMEDLLFFSCVGMVLLLVQHREFDLSKKIENRLGVIFNAKELSPEELVDLKDRILTVGCDARRLDFHIDVRDYDPVLDCILLEVSRTFLMGSYIRKQTVYSNWRLQLQPDDIPGKAPLMEIYPSRKRIVSRDRRKRIVHGEFSDLHPHKVLEVPEVFAPQIGLIEIPWGKALEIEARYCAWQRLHASDKATKEPFRLSTRKHWDKCVVHLENNLRSYVKIEISGAESAAVDLAPGSKHPKPFEMDHFSKDKFIELRFEVSTGN